MFYNIAAEGAVAWVDVLPLRGDGTTGGVVVGEFVIIKVQDGVPHRRPFRGVGADPLEAVVDQVQHGEDHGGCEWGVGEGEDVAADAALELAEGWWLEEASEVGQRAKSGEGGHSRGRCSE